MNVEKQKDENKKPQVPAEVADWQILLAQKSAYELDYSARIIVY